MKQEEESSAWAPLSERVPVRLTAADGARLREFAYAQRIPAAVLGRAAIIAFLDNAERVPLPAVPPATVDLSLEVHGLLQILQPLTSNLSQLGACAQKHAEALGLTHEAATVAAEGIERMRQAARALGLVAREGGFAPSRATELAQALGAPGAGLNAIAKSCNEGQLVVWAEWITPLKAVRAALQEPA